MAQLSFPSEASIGEPMIFAIAVAEGITSLARASWMASSQSVTVRGLAEERRPWRPGA